MFIEIKYVSIIIYSRKYIGIKRIKNAIEIIKFSIRSLGGASQSEYWYADNQYFYF